MCMPPAVSLQSQVRAFHIQVLVSFLLGSHVYAPCSLTSISGTRISHPSTGVIPPGFTCVCPLQSHFNPRYAHFTSKYWCHSSWFHMCMPPAVSLQSQVRAFHIPQHWCHSSWVRMCYYAPCGTFPSTQARAFHIPQHWCNSSWARMCYYAPCGFDFLFILSNITCCHIPRTSCHSPWVSTRLSQLHMTLTPSIHFVLHPCRCTFT
jgi:hypothetical protein